MVEGMWLGVTVASQRDLPAGRVLVSRHPFTLLVRATGGTLYGLTFIAGGAGEVESLYVSIFAVPYDSLSSLQRKATRCYTEQAHSQNR